MEQQDKYLFNARQAVPELLSQIINYKFQPRFQRATSEISVDSGFSTDSNASCKIIFYYICYLVVFGKSLLCHILYMLYGFTAPQPGKLCRGCMSLYCKDCMDQQEIAMKEVEDLLTRLEAAEALYPSSQVMGTFHPIYKNENFVGRIKAMCLWYNITRQNRLKLCIFGKILAR